MDETAVRQLWAQYVAGPRPGEAECREILSTLRGNDSLRRELLDDAQTDGALRGLAERDPEGFVQSVLDCLQAKTDESRFVRRVESELGFRRKRPPWGRLAVAAGLLGGIAALGYVAWRPTDPTPKEMTVEEPAPATGSVDEVTLLPIHGRIVGADWQRVRDEEAASGLALQSGTTSGPAGRRAPTLPGSYVRFSFFAEADKEYAIRIQARGRVDSAIVLEPVNAALVSSCFLYVPAGVPAFAFDGSGLPATYAAVEEGYWWVGQNGRGNLERIPDLTRATVRFNRSGLQTLRLYVQGGPVRVEAIHLSTPFRAGL